MSLRNVYINHQVKNKRLKLKKLNRALKKSVEAALVCDELSNSVMSGDHVYGLGDYSANGRLDIPSSPELHNSSSLFTASSTSSRLRSTL